VKPAAIVVILGLTGVAAAVIAQQAPASRQPSTAAGDWPSYTADVRGTKYSPLDQINAANFGKLEVAWRFKTDSLGPRPEYKLEGTPLAVNGVLYTTGGTRRSVIALDGKTGELMWAHSLREGRRAGVSPRQLSGRGVSGATGAATIASSTSPPATAWCRSTRKPAPIGSFGKDGIVDLKEGAVFGAGLDRSETGEIGLHATPTVARDVVIVGSSMQGAPSVPTTAKGLVRAFDVRTSKLLWTFKTIRCPASSATRRRAGPWAINGGTGSGRRSRSMKNSAWSTCRSRRRRRTTATARQQPVCRGIVCVDLKTGQRKWHYQVVHHPLWNYDMRRRRSRGRHRQRPRHQGGRGPGQAGPCSCSTASPDAGLADRGTAGAADRRARREDEPDAAVPDQAAGLRAQHARVPDDLIDFTPELLRRRNRSSYKVGPWM
jgi:quinoprotein glucose dehydrogenase